MLKRYQIENIVPLIFSLYSVFILLDYFNLSLVYFLGLILIFIGLIFWWWGKMTLGKYFSVLPKANKLISKGIYAKIRHPIYLGVSLLLIGYSLIIKDSIIYFVSFAIILSLLIRAYLEERVLFKRFGKVYLNYRKKTWF